VLAQKGIGTALIEAAERKAGRLRIPSLYAGTESAVSLFSRRGWNPVDRVAESGEQLTIFRSEPYNNSVA
jgi:N-acetylglutamate synthase-like GNAT family acetyltransferase